MDFRKYIILFMTFIILTFIVLGFKTVTSVDISIIKGVQGLMSSFSKTIPLFIGNMTYGFKFWLPILVLALVLIIKRKYVSAVLIFITIQFAYFASDILKAIIGRTRPPMELQVSPLTNPSFPSGHSLLSMCFWGICIYLAHRYIKNNILRWTIFSLCGFMILFTGYTRLWLGVHYPTDLLGGYIIGYCFVLFYCDLEKKLQKN